MTRETNERVGNFLRAALPPVADSELERDLWPLMQARMRDGHLRPSRLDLALACAVALFALLFPPAIPVLLYCL